MSLPPGTRFGPYEVVAQIGAGGMGEVYRARDAKLGRDVALKILPPQFASDRNRMARFEREAKVLASLNHPHIAHLYGLEQTDQAMAIVMELAVGEDLSRRIARGAIPPAETLALARQIAEALEAAHECGVVHRDLKPANIKLCADDSVKVLDFGLAKAAEHPFDARTDEGLSPTVSVVGTEAGTIMGTAAYMSPEQAKGLATDHRSDIFSFGSVVFEMLAGRRAFDGESSSDILASVMAREPDWSALPANLDPRIRRLLARCLAKSRRQRWQAIGDVRSEIETIQSEPFATAGAAARGSELSRWLIVAAMMAAALAGAAASAWMVWRPRPVEPKPVTRLSFVYPEGQRYGFVTRPMLALSPDGSELAYSTQRGIWIRSLATGESRPIVEGPVFNPVFSPDGRSVAFYNNTGTIQRVSVSGGTPTVIASLRTPLAMTWSESGIVFSSGQQILRVPTASGTPETLVDVSAPAIVASPQMLPGDRQVLFTQADGADAASWDHAKTVVVSLDTGQRRIVAEGGMSAVYVPTGHLVMMQGGVLVAMAFDLDRLQVVGDAVPVVSGVMRSVELWGVAQFAISGDGTLVYAAGAVSSNSSQFSLTVTDLSGRLVRLDLAPAAYQTPRYSPDGKSIAFGIADAAGSILVYDLDGKSAPRQLTLEGRNRYPVWSRDGTRVAYQSDRAAGAGIYWQRVDGTGRAERITTSTGEVSHVPEAFASDGTLIYSEVNRDTGALWTVRPGGGAPSPLPQTSLAAPLSAVLSPDGRWLAYGKRTGPGRGAVFVEPYPPTDAKYQISRVDEDAHHPVWAPNGLRLYYVPAPGSLVGVDMLFRPVPTPGAYATVPRGFSYGNSPVDVRGHDISPDGTRFVGVAQTSMLPASGSVAQASVEVVRNWFEELKLKSPRR